MRPLPPAPRFRFAPGGEPSVVGHRGSGAGPDENTLGSFLTAVALGARWVEADVQASSDGTLLLHHDLRLRDGRMVRDLDTSEAAKAGLVRLDELHGALPEDVGINLEVKGSLRDVTSDSTFERSATWVSHRLDERPLLLTSFCPSLAESCSVPVGLLTDRGWQYHLAVLTAVRMGVGVVATHASVVLADDPDQPPLSEILQVVEEHGLTVFAWDVTPGDVDELVRRGVTGLCADDVRGTLEAVGAVPQGVALRR